ncbi:MAG: hypothetical protein HYZ50_23405 [Deltaproteobacteria bacterium]|nr:hypothetical protein [Deltaproteobacteria bacterium]
MAVRGQAERVKAPRALYCEFPLGRPLGRPLDPAYQHQVLAAAFALLKTPAERVPILVDYPDGIVEQGSEALVCTLPPRFDPQVHPAVDEANGLRAAYQRAFARTGCTAFGKALALDTVPTAVQGFLAIADGVTVDQASLPGDPASCAADLRAYYEEAALALADHVPAARQAEAWFFTKTEVGKLLLRAQTALRQAGVPQPVWFYLTPMTRKEMT